MSETNSLAIFTQASQMLAEADTIQKTKELKDLALTAADFAKRKGMGKEAIKYANSYALEAERKMGQLLEETERAKGGNPNLLTSNVTLPVEPSLDGNTLSPSTRPLTLAEMGLTKRESAEAQSLAKLPQETFETVKTGEKTRTKVFKEARHQKIIEKRAEIAEFGKAIPFSNHWQVEAADINTYTIEKQFDFIITDPPYPKEYLPLYETLAKRAKEWLKPEGLLIVMCGQSYLDQIYGILSKHLKYYWTSAYLTPGQPTPLRQRQVNSTWKPILIYSPTDNYSGKIFGDVYKSEYSEKENHDWGQSVSGMLSIIKQICIPGQTIFDPFLGSGSTGVAALQYGCLFNGIDINEQSVNISKSRLAEVK